MTNQNEPLLQFNPANAKVAYVDKVTGVVEEKTYQEAFESDLAAMQVNDSMYVVVTGKRTTVVSEQNDLGLYVPKIIPENNEDIPVSVL